MDINILDLVCYSWEHMWAPVAGSYREKTPHPHFGALGPRGNSPPFQRESRQCMHGSITILVNK